MSDRILQALMERDDAGEEIFNMLMRDDRFKGTIIKVAAQEIAKAMIQENKSSARNVMLNAFENAAKSKADAYATAVSGDRFRKKIDEHMEKAVASFESDIQRTAAKQVTNFASMCADMMKDETVKALAEEFNKKLYSKK